MNHPISDHAEPVPLKAWLREAAAAAGETPALESSEGTLSYRELLARVDALSARLLGCGFEPGERIAIAASRSTDSVIAILAIVDAGLAYLPLDLGYPAARLEAMLADGAPRAVIGEAAALDALRAAVGTFPTLEHRRPQATCRTAPRTT